MVRGFAQAVCRGPDCLLQCTCSNHLKMSAISTGIHKICMGIQPTFRNLSSFKYSKGKHLHHGRCLSSVSITLTILCSPQLDLTHPCARLCAPSETCDSFWPISNLIVSRSIELPGWDYVISLLTADVRDLHRASRPCLDTPRGRGIQLVHSARRTSLG